MIYLFIIIWRILVGLYYIIHDILYFFIFFQWLLPKPIHLGKCGYPTRELHWSIRGIDQYVYDNIFYYLIRPIKI